MVKTEQFTPDEISQAMIKAMGIKSEAARLLKCSRFTIQNYCEKYPEINEAVSAGKMALVDLAQTGLVRNVQLGEGWAIRLVLTTLGKGEGYTTRTELTGPDGAAIQTEDQTAADAAEVTAKLEQLIRSAKAQTAKKPAKQPERKRTGKPKV